MRVIIFSFIYLLLASCYSSLNVNIQDAPKIQKFQFPDKLEVNEKVGVSCMLRSGKPPYTFRWLKDGKELSGENGVYIQSGDRLSTLLIDPIIHASAGNYTCLVKNSAGIDSFSSILTVTASPSWKEEPFDVETVVGEKVSVKCTASGYPNPRIEWIKKGDATFFQRRDQFSLNGTLLFNPISSGDDGEYVCSASNGIGETLVKKITILIHGKKAQ
ncbi:UNVERIFIED_CONTAM: Down syndrome cell adhesion molecule [Trichonephila clavipes]